MSTGPTLKQRAHQLIDQLQDHATWDDVIEEARFRQFVDDGIAAVDQGDFASPEELRAALAKWGVTLGA